MKKTLPVFIATLMLIITMTGASMSGILLEPAADHTHDWAELCYWVEYSTCKTLGEQVRRCIVCQEEKAFTVTITPHDWLKATCIEPLRCKDGCGAIRGIPLGCDHGETVEGEHECQWSDWRWEIMPTCQEGGTAIRHCYLCHQDEVVRTSPGDHLTIMADCGKHQICQYGCGKTIGDPAGDYGFYVHDLPGYPVPVCGLCSRTTEGK